MATKTATIHGTLNLLYARFQEDPEIVKTQKLDEEAIKEVFKYYHRELRTPETTIPLPALMKTVKMLSLKQLQFCDSIKRTLSTMTLLMSELVLVKCCHQKRAIAPKTRTELQSQLRNVIDNTPEIQINTHYHLRCTEAVMNALDPKAEKWKQIVKDYLLPLAEGDTSSDYEPARLILPVIDLVSCVFNELKLKEQLWHPTVLNIRLYFARIRKVQDLDEPIIQELLKKYPEEHSYACCFGEIFTRLILNPEVNTQVKERLFYQEGNESASLTLLARVKVEHKTLWKARYQAVEGLVQIAQESSFTERVLDHLVSCIGSERNLHVQRLLIAAYNKSTSENKQYLKKKIQEINFDEKKSENNLAKAEIQKKLKTVQAEQSLILEKLLNKEEAHKQYLFDYSGLQGELNAPFLADLNYSQREIIQQKAANRWYPIVSKHEKALQAIQKVQLKLECDLQKSKTQIQGLLEEEQALERMLEFIQHIQKQPTETT